MYCLYYDNDGRDYYSVRKSGGAGSCDAVSIVGSRDVLVYGSDCVRHVNASTYQVLIPACERE